MTQPALYDQDVKALFDQARYLNDRPRVDELLNLIEARFVDVAREHDRAVGELGKALAREKGLRVLYARALREPVR